MKIVGRPIISGKVTGRALVLREPFAFAHSINPKTGVVGDRRLPIAGLKLHGRVFVFPYGRGSTTGSTWMLELARQDRLPVAIINLETEPVIASGLLLSQALYGVNVPTIDHLQKNPFDFVETGNFVEVDSEHGFIRIHHAVNQRDSTGGVVVKAQSRKLTCDEE